MMAKDILLPLTIISIKKTMLYTQQPYWINASTINIDFVFAIKLWKIFTKIFSKKIISRSQFPSFPKLDHFSLSTGPIEVQKIYKIELGNLNITSLKFLIQSNSLTLYKSKIFFQLPEKRFQREKVNQKLK